MSARSRLRLGVALAFGALTFAGAHDAAAEGASGAAFSALPTGRVAPPPRTKAPASIPGSEKVAGFFLSPQRGGGGARSEYVNVVSSAKAAKQLNEGSRDGLLSGEACFTEDQPEGRRAADDSEPTWNANLRPNLTLSMTSAWGQRPGVTAVHSERIAEEDGHVSLEVDDAWVDPSTRGARLISRSTVPLELVSTLYGGGRVFAARDGQTVQVVLVTVREKKRLAQDGLFAIADGNIGNSACDHIRVSLKAEKGQGQTATFIANAELPSLEPKVPAPAKTEPPPVGLANQLRAANRLEARVRPMHVNASVSWPSREKEALLSVSAGWDSRERSSFVF